MQRRRFLKGIAAGGAAVVSGGVRRSGVAAGFPAERDDRPVDDGAVRRAGHRHGRCRPGAARRRRLVRTPLARRISRRPAAAC